MNIFQSFTIGTFSGIVASFIVLAVVTLFRGAIIPWYRKLIYRGINISGIWQAPLATHTFNLEMKQEANSVHGASTLVYSDKPNTVRTFKLRGSIRDRFFEFRINHVDPSQLGLAVGFFEIVGDGNTMEGYVTGYDTGKHSILTNQMTLKREKRRVL